VGWKRRSSSVILAVPLLAAVAAAAAVAPAAGSVGTPLAQSAGQAARSAVPSAAPRAAAVATAGGLSVFVGYAEDKETNNPDPASFPVPWAGAPNTTFLGGTVPGQAACGTLTVCYDAGAIRLDNTTSAPVTVDRVDVDMHSSLAGGKVFPNLWGSFTVPAGHAVILTANPPNNNPGFDNFDTSGFPPNMCTPVTVAPTVKITIGGVATTLADSTHVLDTGGIDAGFCKMNESFQWRAIGALGTKDGSLQLAPAMATAVDGKQVTETATVLDGSGYGTPDATVNFSVTSGPDAGQSGQAVTDGMGQASFTYTGAQGEDVVVASVTSVGSFQSNTARVMWTSNSSGSWSARDIGTPTPPGGQTVDPVSGTWMVKGGGTGISGTADQFHFLWQTLTADGGAAAHVTAQTATSPPAAAGVLLRTSLDAASPYYAALVTPGNGIEIQDRATLGAGTTQVVNLAGAAPAYVWAGHTGNTFTTYTSSDGYTWSPVPGSAVTLNLGSGLLAGLAVTAGSSAVANTATMDTVAVSAAPPAPVPPVPCLAPWTCADIGTPAPAGSQAFDPNNGTWTINAGGADITGTADQFRFIQRPLSGDGSIIAHVTSQTNTSSNAKAGLMLRASTDPGAPNYAVLVSPGAGIKVQVRKTQGGSTAKLANPAGTTPAYLKITRSGTILTAYTSADGVTWTLITGSTVTLVLGSAPLQGLAVTSHKAGSLGTVTFDGVQAG
jgi:hypothetical protein